MAITYKIIWSGLSDVKTPVLHTVHYGYSNMPQLRHEWIIKDREIREWCKANCRAKFYLHPGYTYEKFVQFEDDEDAVIFSLKFGH